MCDTMEACGMIAKANRDAGRSLGLRARLGAAWEALRCFAEDVSDTVVSWWRVRFPGGPPIPLEDVKRDLGP